MGLMRKGPGSGLILASRPSTQPGRRENPTTLETERTALSSLICTKATSWTDLCGSTHPAKQPTCQRLGSTHSTLCARPSFRRTKHCLKKKRNKILFTKKKKKKKFFKKKKKKKKKK